MLSSPNFRVSDISAERGRRPIFENLSFEISTGRIAQVLGSNGSGKTTLLRILAGLCAPEKGVVLWNNRNIYGDGRDGFLNDCVYVGHKTGISDDATAAENLVFFQDLHAARAKQNYHRALNSVGFNAPADTLTGKVSAGQRQRIALAKLMMVEAAMWILDEPFNALDRQGRLLIESLFVQHCEQGGMVILATHQALEHNSENIASVALAENF